jgi:hypothetical protein
MIATRYTLPVAVLLSIALVPTIIHSYLNLSIDNSSPAKSISAMFSDLTSTPTRKNPGWGEETFGCTDWFERTYKDKQGNEVRLFVGRGYDHKRLYHHPELALSHAVDLRSTGLIKLLGEHVIPVNVLHHTTQSKIAGYALFYDGHFIDDPIAHQVKNSLSLLVNAKKPMTLFYVSEDNIDNQTNFEKTLSAKVLTAAIKNYLVEQPVKAP